MKKVFKNPIFTYILGFVTALSITSVLAYSTIADDVGYTPTDDTWDVEDVSAALDDLYEKNHRYRILVGSVTRNDLQKDFDCTQYKGWKYLTIENFGVVITGLYGNGSVNQSYFSTDDSSFSYDNTTGTLHIKNWHGISARTDLRYAANIYLYM